MNWTERQRDMLRLMGVRIWSQPDTVEAEAPHRAAEAVAEPEPQAAVESLLSAPAAVHPPPQALPTQALPPRPVQAAAPAPDRPRLPQQAGPGAPAAARDVAERPEWRALQQEVAECSLCRLHAHRSQALFGPGIRWRNG